MYDRPAARRRPRLLQVVTVAGVAALACYGLSAASAASTAKPARTHAPARVWIKPSRAGACARAGFVVEAAEAALRP